MPVQKKKRDPAAPKRTDLGTLSVAWQGWRLIGNKLTGPLPGLRVSVDDVKAIPLVHAKIEVQRQKIRALQEEIDRLKELPQEQSLPETWTVPTVYPQVSAK
jgi:hypothetical protein